MSETIVVSDNSVPMISTGFMHAALTILSIHEMDSEEVNQNVQNALRISKYMYQILGSLLQKGKAVNSSIQKRIETTPPDDPFFDPEFDPKLFQECFSATRETLKVIKDTHTEPGAM